MQAALQRLDRPVLALLATAGEIATSEGAPTAARLADELGVTVEEVEERARVAEGVALLGAESGRYAPWDAVIEQLRAWPAFGLPTRERLVDDPPPAALEPVSEADARFVDRGAAERAFGTVTAMGELLRALDAQPARQLARGGVALPDARRLAAAAGIESDAVDRHLDVAARAGLARLDGGSWIPDVDAGDWLRIPRLARWARLAGAWLDRLPEDLVTLLRSRAHAVWGDGLLEFVAWLFPAGGDWVRDRVEVVAREAELLGLLGGATPSSAGAALLVDGEEAAAAVMGSLFPAEVDRVYLQPDLSIIAPGPLVAEVDDRLRRLADVETLALASTYRISPASITRALVAGETVDGIREFLRESSLTGLPQPVEYLLDDTAQRFGSLRVGALDPGLAGGSRSYVRALDPALLPPLEVDPALGSLGLERGDEPLRLVSRFDEEVLFEALVDARYAVVAEDPAGTIVAPPRHRREASGQVVGDDTAVLLVQRVRRGAAAEPADTGRAWMERQLELAVKNRMTVSVTVQLPDGTEADYLLEPASLAGGRLRARDRRADIERTLPFASITSVTPR
ncbi:helicase-associated domain-containing protein [Pseudolysinimonas sp.]|uniref:helicase-associated domain-containing protein n=1 Tax=Pseudolysinimonas sp. TaxID=2680009 RepID=UPI003F7E52FB